MPASKTQCALGIARYTDPDCRDRDYTGNFFPCDKHSPPEFREMAIRNCARGNDGRFNTEEEEPLPDMCEKCQRAEARKKGDLDDAKAGANRR